MAQDTQFEMPHLLRELTERNFAQARGAYIQFLDAIVQTTNMGLGAVPLDEMTSSMKLIHEKAMLQTQMQTYALQAQELGRLMADASQTVRPKG
jgi:hypothetical protein